MFVQRIFRTRLCRFSEPNPTLLLHHVAARGLPSHSSLLRSLRTSNWQNIRSTRPKTSVEINPLDKFGSTGSVPPGNVLKALIFTGAFSGGCFVGATIMEYENTRSMMMKKARQSLTNFKRNSSASIGSTWQQFHKKFNYYWEQLNPGQKIFAPICAINLLVFGLWRIPSLRSTMLTYFCSNPVGRVVCWPMFLSTFSHYSAFHIFANMYVLHSFANAAVLSMGKEQFLAVYLSGGVIASLASIAYKAVTMQAGLSIGASGAIMTILAYVCARFPDTQLGILFLPTLTFSAGSAIKVIMGIDLAGCLMGWKFFDHAAHLGGAVFGTFWAFFGIDVWQQRLPILALYHDWRKTK